MGVILLNLEAIEKLVAYAKNNVIDFDQYNKEELKNLTPVGDNLNRRIRLEPKYTVVFSIEIHKGKKYRHLSISSSDNKALTKESLNILIKEFGFVNKFENCHFYLEEIKINENFTLQAANIVELINGDSEV